LPFGFRNFATQSDIHASTKFLVWEIVVRAPVDFAVIAEDSVSAILHPRKLSCNIFWDVANFTIIKIDTIRRSSIILISLKLNENGLEILLFLECSPE
jgi:hypothetical protein